MYYIRNTGALVKSSFTVLFFLLSFNYLTAADNNNVQNFSDLSAVFSTTPASTTGNATITVPVLTSTGSLTANNKIINILSGVSGGVELNGNGATPLFYINNSGTINFTDISFGDSARPTSHGGAMRIDTNGKATFSGITNFENNEATTGAAGALYVNTGSILFNDNVNFITNNALGGTGGAIYLNTSSAEFNGEALFERNNSSSSGGAIYMTNNSTLEFKDKAEFTSNTGLGGGAINSAGGDITFGGAAIFDSNIAAAASGAIYAANGTLTFESTSLFNNNEARGSSSGGGAIYLRNNTATFKGDTVFTNNKSGNSSSSNGHGGGLYMVEGGTVTFQGKVTADGNTATGVGGFFANNISGSGILDNSKIIDFDKESVFRNNTSGLQGGAVYSITGVMNFNDNVLFENNSSTASNGGALYLGASSNTQGSFNATVNFNGDEVKFIENSSFGSGGAVGLYAGASSPLKPSLTFGTLGGNETLIAKGNTAGSNGGFLYNSSANGEDAGTVIFNSASTFGGSDINPVEQAKLSNTANNGGAIFNYNNGVVTFNNTADFIKNNARAYGGAVYNYGKLDFNGAATFTENTAVDYGGAMFIGGDTTFADSVAFDGNKSGINGTGGRGGAVYTNGKILFKGESTFTNNYASDYGGALFMNNLQTVTFEDKAVFTGNTVANNTGGAIYMNGGIINFEGGASLSGNTDSAGNNDIFMGGAAGSTMNLSGTENFTFSSGIAGVASSTIINTSSGKFTAEVSRYLGSYSQSAGSATAEISGDLSGNTGVFSILGGQAEFKGSVLTAGKQIINDGTVIFSGSNKSLSGIISGTGIMNVSGSITNTGTISQNALNILTNGSLTSDADTLTIGTGGINIAGNSALYLSKGTLNMTGGALNLNGSGAVLDLHNPTPDFNQTTVTANVASVNAVSGSQIHMDVFANGTSDVINVSGAAVMNNELRVKAGVGTYNGTEFTLVDATGGSLSGDLIDDINNNPGNYNLAFVGGRGVLENLYVTYVFDAANNTVKLVLTGTSSSALNRVAASFNQKQVSKTLDEISSTATSDMAAVINGITDGSMTDEQTKAALSEISPYFLANVLRPRVNTSYREGIYNRLKEYCPETGCSKNSLWMQAEYDWRNLAGNENSLGDYKINSGGVKFGTDRYFYGTNFIGGLYGMYNLSDIKQKDSKGDISSFGGGVYGGFLGDKWEFRGLAGASFDDYNLKRKIYAIPGGLDRTAKSDFVGFTFNTDIEMAYKSPLTDTLLMQPYAGIEASALTYETFTEKDAQALNQHVRGDAVFGSTARLGLRLRSTTAKLSWHAGAEYNFILKGNKSEITSNFEGIDNNFKTRGAEIGRHAIGLSGGADYNLNKNWNIYANAELKAADDYNNASASLGVRYSFCSSCAGKDKKASEPKKQAFVEEIPQAEEPVPLTEKKPSAAPVSNKIATTYYAFDKSDLTPSAKEALDDVIVKVKDDETIGLIVIGHTDSTGPEAYNQKLSERRAKNVYDYLKSKGIEERRIAAIGKGELSPIADNATRAGRAENRRVEILIH